MKDIGYKSENGYTGYLYGKSSMSIVNPDGNEVMHTSSRKVNTEEELKKAVDHYPELSRYTVTRIRDDGMFECCRCKKVITYLGNKDYPPFRCDCEGKNDSSNM